jgi:hypothetical protein
MDQFDQILILISLNIILDDRQSRICGKRIIEDVLNILIRLALNTIQGAQQENLTVACTGDNADSGIGQGVIGRHKTLIFLSGTYYVKASMKRIKGKFNPADNKLITNRLTH